MTNETLLAYAWPQSVDPGSSFALHVSSPVPDVEIEIARDGWRREIVLTTTLHDVGEFALPDDVDAHGAGWPVTLEIDAGTDWASGYYEILLRANTAAGALEHRAFVVVRPAPDTARSIVLVLATNTWNAYNDIGDRSLYTGGVQVDFRRPMAPGFLYKPPGLGRRVAAAHGVDPDRAAHTGWKYLHGLSNWCGSAGWPDWERPFLAWAEREGYGVDVVSNADLERDPALLGRYRLMLSVGHDEYWSAAMRAAVESFIGDGGNVAFLSGNIAFWQVRYENDGTVMIGYKDHLEQDPLYGTDRQAETTTMWSDHIIGNPENRMTGVSFTTGGYVRIGKRVPAGSAGWTMYRPQHWLFAGTGLQYGDVLGAAAGVVGYECDGCRFQFKDGLPYPTGEDGTPDSFEILAMAPAQHFDPESGTRPVHAWEREMIATRLLGERSERAVARIAHGHAVFGTYTRNGTVVTAGSTDWAHGLAEHDPQVEQVTRNILDRLG